MLYIGNIPVKSLKSTINNFIEEKDTKRIFYKLLPSIKKEGLKVPIVIDNEFNIAYGNNRYFCVNILQWKNVKCIIVFPTLEQQLLYKKLSLEEWREFKKHNPRLPKIIKTYLKEIIKWPI